LPGEAPEVGEASEEVKRLREENLYLRAELDNLRKLLEREVEEAGRRAAERLVLTMLTMYEEVERIYNNAQTADPETTLEGLRILVREMRRMLSENGIRAMEVIGKKFDPFIHEAVGFVEREDVDDDVIIAEVSKGYEFRGRVIKPPRVIVSRKPHQREANSSDG
jgi:molecular chaperone GrpE